MTNASRVKNAENTRGRPFSAGNPGRPAGTPNKRTLALQELVDGEGEAITRKAIELAKSGDPTAIRLMLDRLLPPRKDRPIPFALPKLETAADAKTAAAAIVHAVAEGDLTPSEAADMSKLLDNFTRVLEATDFQARLEALERKTSQ
jgi:hypothetical protein